MSNIHPEEYREEMQAIYAAINKHRDVVSKNITFDELSYFKDGKDEFIIGTHRQSEDTVKTQRVSSHTQTQSTLLCMPLKNGKLTGEVLQILSSSNTDYTYSYTSRDGNEYMDKPAKTSVLITTGNIATQNVVYAKDVLEYHDVTDWERVSAVVVSKQCKGKNKELGDKKIAIKICDRFLEPRGEASRQMEAEKERLKRVKRFGELRKMVERKHAKIAEKQAKQKAKEAKQQAKEAEKKRTAEVKKQKEIRDKFIR